jgi:predicted phage tail protein
LRNLILLVTIKPHSAFSKYFSAKEYVADFKTYNDILFYLNSMHKRFINYLRIQRAQKIEESFVFLDKNLKVINPNDLKFKHARDGDVIYIVPAVVGGGGKRGGILAALAVAMFIFIPMAAGAAAAGAAAPVGAAVAGAGGIGGTIAGALGGMGGFLQNLVVNIGLALLSSLFATKPSEENTRQNDMFGSLVNSTASGTPVPLNYGMMRIAGQLISGYVLSVGHGKTQNLNVYGEVLETATTAAADQELERALFLAGYNGDTATGLQIFSASGNFTVPAGINSLTVIVAGGGGTGGASATHYQTSATLNGGQGGAGGLVIAQISVTPGQVIPVVVGTNGLLSARTSTFGTPVLGTFPVRATGGANGTAAYGGSTFNPARTGITGTAGTGYSTQPNSIVYSGNVGTPEWSTKLLALRYKFIGSATVSYRQQVLDMAEQQYNILTSTWTSTGVNRPGGGGPVNGLAGTTGAVIVIY